MELLRHKSRKEWYFLWPGCLDRTKVRSRLTSSCSGITGTGRVQKWGGRYQESYWRLTRLWRYRTLFFLDRPCRTRNRSRISAYEEDLVIRDVVLGSPGVVIVWDSPYESPRERHNTSPRVRLLWGRWDPSKGIGTPWWRGTRIRRLLGTTDRHSLAQQINWTRSRAEWRDLDP